MKNDLNDNLNRPMGVRWSALLGHISCETGNSRRSSVCNLGGGFWSRAHAINLLLKIQIVLLKLYYRADLLRYDLIFFCKRLRMNGEIVSLVLRMKALNLKHSFLEFNVFFRVVFHNWLCVLWPNSGTQRPGTQPRKESTESLIPGPLE